MFLQSSCRTVKVSCQFRYVQFSPRLCNLQKVFIQPQEPKPEPSIDAQAKKLEKQKEKKNFTQFDGNSQILINIDQINNNTLSKNQTWREGSVDYSKLGQYCLNLSKFKLTSLVVMTSMIGYAMAPNPFEVTSFLGCAVGTGLVSSAASAINQFLEMPFDAQMSRTRNRVLVKGHLMPLHAIGFASAAGSLGLAILLEQTNVITAALGASNLVLYTLIYTPLKRFSILNTWVGSIVGAIPPLMGWAACQGSLDPGAFILGGILYAWQFPHFNALSWNLRGDYCKAGYRMMAVTNPGLCRRTAFRYTLGITAISSLAPVFGVTNPYFGILSLPVNLYFSYLGFKFYKEADRKTSRKLFLFSLLHLPILMGLMLLTKQGLFDSLTNSQVSAVHSMKKNEINGDSKKSNFDVTNEHGQDLNSSLTNLNLNTSLNAAVMR